MRPLVSYDDITQPQALPNSPTNVSVSQHPAKKRKTTQNGGRSQSHQSVQHWDDPGTHGPQMNYDDTSAAVPSTSKATAASENVVGEEADYEEEEEESRELTHEEIWDDSALIEAWNSAAAEYEAYHGSGKKWKEEPVKKSPLWYNVPPKAKAQSKASNSSTLMQNDTTRQDVDATVDATSDSVPLNFDTFVPTHDPSLATSTLPQVPSMDTANGTMDLSTISQDEAFSRAMTAMYWSGYWTAIYHARRDQTTRQGVASVENETEEDQDGREEDEDMEDDDEEMLPAQR